MRALDHGHALRGLARFTVEKDGDDGGLRC
jgi:hypothetical protein